MTQEQIAKIKAWWQQRKDREKQAIVWGGSVLGIVILYVGIWSPFLSSVSELRNHIKTDKALLAWMQAADKEIQKKSKNTTQTQILSPVELLSALQKKVQQTGLDKYLTQLKQSSNDAVEMQFSQVEFDKLINMLMSISKTYQITINQLSAQPTDKPGVVNVSVMVKL